MLIEHCYLDLANLEALIDDRLRSHGSRIDPETWYFLSQVRDVIHKSSSRSMAWIRERTFSATVTADRRGRRGNVVSLEAGSN